MSHLTSIKTQIRDVTALSNALQEMGLLLGGAWEFKGDGRAVKAEATIVLEGGMLVGVVRGADGTLELVCDSYYTRRALGPEHEFVGRLSQLYGVHKAMIEATLEGYAVERQTDANGIIRLTLTRA